MPANPRQYRYRGAKARWRKLRLCADRKFLPSWPACAMAPANSDLLTPSHPTTALTTPHAPFTTHHAHRAASGTCDIAAGPPLRQSPPARCAQLPMAMFHLPSESIPAVHQTAACCCDTPQISVGSSSSERLQAAKHRQASRSGAGGCVECVWKRWPPPSEHMSDDRRLRSSPAASPPRRHRSCAPVCYTRSPCAACHGHRTRPG